MVRFLLDFVHGVRPHGRMWGKILRKMADIGPYFGKNCGVLGQISSMGSDPMDEFSGENQEVTASRMMP